jgi:hypothetical protein
MSTIKECPTTYSSSSALDIGEIHAELERVLNSERFRKAPSLSQLLQYLVSTNLDGHAAHIKETTIGIEVFGRPGNFDGRTDNIVRVQAHRLRKLLEGYYAGKG